MTAVYKDGLHADHSVWLCFREYAFVEYLRIMRLFRTNEHYNVASSSCRVARPSHSLQRSNMSGFRLQDLDDENCILSRDPRTSHELLSIQYAERVSFISRLFQSSISPHYVTLHYRVMYCQCGIGQSQ